MPATLESLTYKCIDTERIEEPDYAQHPAFGGMFPKVRFTAQCRALSRLIPWIVFLWGKRCMFGDRFPPLPGHDRGIRGGLAMRIQTAMRYFPFFFKNCFAQFARRTASATSANTPLALELERSGIALGVIAKDDLKELKARIERPFAALLDSKATKADVFETCQKLLDRETYTSIYEAAEKSLVRAGVISAAGRYLKRDATVVRLLLQVNDATDPFFFENPFADAGVRTPSTMAMHMDTNYGVLKCMVYLSDVAEENGPFCYVAGSHRLKQGGLEGLVRRAVDRSGLSRLDPKTRELFMALPSVFRKKCSIGSDYLEGSTTARQLTASEFHWTSEAGNFAIFDPIGLHRGGAVMEGQRRAMFAILG